MSSQVYRKLQEVKASVHKAARQTENRQSPTSSSHRISPTTSTMDLTTSSSLPSVSQHRPSHIKASSHRSSQALSPARQRAGQGQMRQAQLPQTRQGYMWQSQGKAMQATVDHRSTSQGSKKPSLSRQGSMEPRHIFAAVSAINNDRGLQSMETSKKKKNQNTRRKKRKRQKLKERLLNQKTERRAEPKESQIICYRPVHATKRIVPSN